MKEESLLRDTEAGRGGEMSNGLLKDEAEEGEVVLVEVPSKVICDGGRGQDLGWFGLQGDLLTRAATKRPPHNSEVPSTNCEVTGSFFITSVL